MATEGAVHTAKDHVWHMTEIAAIVGTASELLIATPYQVVDLSDGGASEAAAFRQLQPVPEILTQKLWTITNDEMLPAVKRQMDSR